MSLSTDTTISSSITPITEEEYARQVAEGYNYAFEATPYWDSIDALAPGRELFQDTALKWQKADYTAVFKLKRYRIKRLNFLWSRGAPIWNRLPEKAVEAEFTADLKNYVQQRDKSIDFLRLSSFTDFGVPDCQQISYDTTVQIDLRGDADDIKKRMKKRGRRDINKALRECPGECQDETFISAESYQELMAIMEETGKRDTFAIKKSDFYFRFLDTLRSVPAEKSISAKLPVRLFTYREEGKVQAWAMFTIYGERASYYFAASTRTGQQHLAPDYLLWYSLNELAASGVTSLDLLGIGSDLAPHLRTLNTFKTKFATETVAVPPYREIILHPMRYKICNILADLKQKIRPLSN